ncbi:MAG: helix-turn-helix domain-containing protein [Bacteroidota bacterium]
MHEGNLLKKIIKKSGYSISSLAKQLHVSRITLYKKFALAKVPPTLLIAIGRIIGHDFSYVNEEVKKYMRGYIFSFVKLQRNYMQALYSYIETLNDTAKILTKIKNKQTQTDLVAETTLSDDLLFAEDEDWIELFNA